MWRWRRCQSITAVTGVPGARRRHVGIGGRHVHDLARGRTLLGVDDAQLAAIGQPQQAGIAGLAAALRIEHRAIEPDAGGIDGEHTRVALRQRGIFAEQFFGH